MTRAAFEKDEVNKILGWALGTVEDSANWKPEDKIKLNEVISWLLNPLPAEVDKHRYAFS